MKMHRTFIQEAIFEPANKVSFILYLCGVGTQGDPWTVTTSDLLCIPIQFLKIPDSSTRALWKLPRHLIAKQEKLGKWLLNFAYKVSLSYLVGFFNMP
jgi:hypothetical protein